jgi:hypothetical protein
MCNVLRKKRRELEKLIVNDNFVIDDMKRTKNNHLHITVRSTISDKTAVVYTSATPSCHRSYKNWRSKARQIVAESC